MNSKQISTSSSGRIIIDGPCDPVRNMAIDEALAQSCKEGNSGFPVIRFYWWSKPTLSLGAKERLNEAADLEVCRELGISLVRRPTGGRSVLHDQELTYAIIASTDKPPFQTSVEESYRMIAEAQASAVNALGINLMLTAGGRKIRPRSNQSSEDSANAVSPGSHLPCFAAPSRYELTWQGKKVIGSAQRRLRGAVLQHGSILLQSDVGRLARITRGEAEALSNLVIGLEEIAGRSISRESLIQAMSPAIQGVFNDDFAVGYLTDYEIELVEDLVPEIESSLDR
jgi:lipoate-protein ligase A